MNRRSALGSLFWKETRQILPLVWLQLGMGIVLQLLIALQQSPFMPQLLVIMGMPSLFALGVGAILVGQEREQRTLDWLRWMPIAPSDILRMKLVVGLVSLVVVWCLNLLIMVVFVLPQQSWRGMTAIDFLGFFDTGWEYHWPLQSLFFLAAGFATAWLFRSSLVSVLALIPLAFSHTLLLLIILGLLETTTSDGLQRIHWAPWIIGGTLVAFTLVLAVIGWRVGLRRLGAESHGEQQRAWRLFFRNPWDDTPVWTGPAHSVGSMLVWQFLRQHRTPLLGIAAMMAGALVLIAAGGPVAAARGYGTFMAATFLILLVTSWLGVLAFQGDALHERIRFLAERGVSPGKVWATRHVVPLSLLTVVLAAVLALLGRTSGSLDVAPNFISSPPVVLMMVFVLFFTYGISQFVGQIFRSATIAAIAAPVVAWSLLFYSVFLFTQVRAPYWLLAIFVSMPWLATWIMMRRWMDGRLGWGFWGTHAGLLAAGLLLPLGPTVMVIVSQPTMPAEVRRQLTAEAEGYQREYGVWAFSEPQELVLSVRDSDAEDPPPANRLIEGQIIREQWKDQLASDLEPLAIPASRRPVRFTPQWPRFLFGEATLARQALERDADSELQLQRYRETMALIDTLIDRLRRSWRLVEQDGADLIEIWLVRELKRPNTRQHLGDELYGRLVRSLGDDTGRNAARRRALVLSWARYRNRLRTSLPANQLGGYGWIGESGSGLYAVSPYSRRRAADYLAWLMLQRLERHEGWDRDTQIQELAKYWDVPEMVYGVGLGGEFMRADDVHRFAMPVEGISRRAPGSQWHAGWERVAKELACDAKGSGVVFGQRPTTWNTLSPKTTPAPWRKVVGTLCSSDFCAAAN